MFLALENFLMFWSDMILKNNNVLVPFSSLISDINKVLYSSIFANRILKTFMERKTFQN